MDTATGSKGPGLAGRAFRHMAIMTVCAFGLTAGALPLVTVTSAAPSEAPSAGLTPIIPIQRTPITVGGFQLTPVSSGGYQLTPVTSGGFQRTPVVGGYQLTPVPATTP